MKNNNWRLMVGKRRKPNELNWRIYLHEEYVQFALEAEHLSELYDWNFWGGGVGNYAVTLSQSKSDGLYISIKIVPMYDYKYYASFSKEWNPNNIELSEYETCIGETMEDALKYLHTFLLENKYIRENNWNRTCIMGGAYKRYPLALKWAREELEENNTSVSI